MNSEHAALCSSPEWAEHIRDVVVPEVLESVSLGDDVLEIGPGYGPATQELVRRLDHLTVVEVDPALAVDLLKRFPTVSVWEGSGAELPFPSGRFSAVVCFTMLHHVSSAGNQDALFAEAHRVLRPGGVFAGSDSIGNEGLCEFHGNDTYVPVDPATLPDRLCSAGFKSTDVRVTAPNERFAFTATTSS